MVPRAEEYRKRRSYYLTRIWLVMDQICLVVFVEPGLGVVCFVRPECECCGSPSFQLEIQVLLVVCSSFLRFQDATFTLLPTSHSLLLPEEPCRAETVWACTRRPGP